MSESLVSVSVTSGTISAQCFYGFTLEEVDLCKVGAERISREAFTGAAVARIHSPRADVVLTGEYESSVALCGCTIYERVAVL